MKTEHPEEYRRLQEWLLRSEDEQSRVLRHAEQAFLLHRAQGASKELLSLSNVFANAQEMATEVAKQKAGIFSPP